MATIREIIESKGIEIVGQSDIGDKINNFDSWISEQLFTFLINNQLNRYLFNSIIRMGTLDIENWPFNLEILSPSKIKEKVKESFIKKFTCTSCGQILFNESYVDLIKLNDSEEIECPKCKIRLEMKYEGLEDSFEVSKNILSEFMEQLVSRGIIKIHYTKHCLNCRTKRIIEEIEKTDNSSLKCEKCNNYCNIGRDYFFENQFLKDCLIRRGGDWFEWYVYKLCSYMHQEVEHNLVVKIGKEGKEIELDVIGRDEDKLIIYECKDTQKPSSWKDFENIPNIVENFDNVTLVNSYDTNKKDLKKLLEPYKKEINIIKGSDLEDNFIGLEPTLLRLKSSEWPYSKNGVNSFKKLSQDKRVEIVNRLLSDISLETDLVQNLLAFIKISNDDYFFKDLLLKKEKKLSLSIIKKFYDNINSANIKGTKFEEEIFTQMILFIREILKDLEKKDLLSVCDFNGYVNLGLSALSGKFGEGLINPSNQYYTTLFDIFDGEESKLSNSEVESLFDSLIPTLDRYSNWSRRTDILNLIYRLVPYVNKERLISLVPILKNSVSNYSWSINGAITEICKRIFSRLDYSIKSEIKDLLIKMSNEKELTSVKYANDTLTELFN